MSSVNITVFLRPVTVGINSLIDTAQADGFQPDSSQLGGRIEVFLRGDQ